MNELHPGLSLTASMVISAMLAVVVVLATTRWEAETIACGLEQGEVHETYGWYHAGSCVDERRLARQRCYDELFATNLRELEVAACDWSCCLAISCAR